MKQWFRLIRHKNKKKLVSSNKTQDQIQKRKYCRHKTQQKGKETSRFNQLSTQKNIILIYKDALYIAQKLNGCRFFAIFSECFYMSTNKHLTSPFQLPKIDNLVLYTIVVGNFVLRKSSISGVILWISQKFALRAVLFYQKLTCFRILSTSSLLIRSKWLSIGVIKMPHISTVAGLTNNC